MTFARIFLLMYVTYRKGVEIMFDDPNKKTREMQRIMNQHHQEKAKYDAEAMKTWKNIEDNTASLSSVVTLLQQNTRYQKEILESVNEINKIAIANTPDEADSKYSEVMKKLERLEGNIDNLNSLRKYAQTIWMLAKAYFNAE